MLRWRLRHALLVCRAGKRAAPWRSGEMKSACDAALGKTMQKLGGLQGRGRKLQATSCRVGGGGQGVGRARKVVKPSRLGATGPVTRGF